MVASTASKTVSVKSSKTDIAEALTTAFAARIVSMREAKDHATPNLGALVRATRTALGEVSQMSLGENRTKDGKVLVKDVALGLPANSAEKGFKKSGWFSLIANVEQGGRKTAIPTEFVTYLSAVTGVSVDDIAKLIEQDAALRTASQQANTPA